MNKLVTTPMPQCELSAHRCDVSGFQAQHGVGQHTCCIILLALLEYAISIFQSSSCPRQVQPCSEPVEPEVRWCQRSQAGMQIIICYTT